MLPLKSLGVVTRSKACHHIAMDYFSEEVVVISSAVVVTMAPTSNGI